MAAKKINQDNINEDKKEEKNITKKGLEILRDEQKSPLDNIIQLQKEINKPIEAFKSISDIRNIIDFNFDHKIFIPNLQDSIFSALNSHNQIKLIEDEATLKVRISKLTSELLKESADKENFQNKSKELTEQLDELREITRKNHVISRVSEFAGYKISTSSEFYDNFTDGKQEDTVVISIDIRRSTELMLKARTPKLFSEFITGLSFLLSDCIKTNLGIFDKFTGDGILAFFPKFYSGDQAIIRAYKAAEECHKLFTAHYSNSKSSFNVFIKDVGLGIGIDYGNVTLVNTSSELTVVGIPVVYACRFSGANAGNTLLNVPAKEELERLCSNQTTFSETELYIKNEGNALAYMAVVNPSVFDSLEEPDWLNENADEKNASEEIPNPS